MNKVCAIFVIYHPQDDFYQHIRTIAAQVDEVVLVDNTPGHTEQLDQWMQDDFNLKIFSDGENKGIAKALNIGIAYAIENNYVFAITFDQDTEFSKNIVSELFKIYDSILPKETIGILAANYVDKRTGGVAFSGVAYDYSEQKCVITSGSLMNLKNCREVGNFDERYFIDMVDYEYCYRLRKNGFKVYITQEPYMEQNIGHLEQRHFIRDFVLSNHAPQRRYYIFRNSLKLVRDYFSFDFYGCMTILCHYLPVTFIKTCFFEKHKFENLKWILLGIFDFVTGNYTRKVL